MLAPMAIAQKEGLMELKLSLIPPTPVTDQITITAFCGVRNDSDQTTEAVLTLSWQADGEQELIGKKRVILSPRATKRVRFDFASAQHEGRKEIVAAVIVDGLQTCVVQELEVLKSDTRATGQVAGAWVGIEHWSDEEGAPWNADIRTMTDEDWRELVVAMHDLRMDFIVVQECLRNQQYVGRHDIETAGYQGKAFYPSKLFPGRVNIAAKDPLEAILSEADKHGMKVAVGVGMYAWFDFSEGSLEWHKKVATELFEMYGHHESFFTWYVSAEAYGSLGTCVAEQESIVKFFEGFQAHVQALAPEKPVMLAPNCHDLRSSADYYDRLLPNLDIICPFAFHRMPEDDFTGEEAAAWLQTVCDKHGTHLWLDMEAFLFGPDMELLPRPLDGLLSDMRRFPNFEKTLIYQFPGLLTSPRMRVKLGGDAAVTAHREYQAWLEGKVAELSAR